MTAQNEAFRVVVNGGVIGGKDPADVVESFAKLIRVDTDKASEYFQGKPRVIKKNTDRATALKYKKALTAIGVDTLVVELDESGAPKQAMNDAQAAPPAAPKLELEARPEDKLAEERQVAGPTMVCPACNTLQPRGEQCPGCGVFVEKARKAKEAREAKGVGRTAEKEDERTVSKPGGESLGMKSFAAASIAALLGALVWMGVAVGFNRELGWVAWGVGGLVGFASAVTGARGGSAGMMCAMLAMCAIIGGKIFAVQQFQDSGWITDEDSVFWYEEYKLDAELYQELDGSDADLRAFIFERNYTEAWSETDVSQADIDDFMADSAPMLEWMTESDPAMEEWVEYMNASIAEESAFASVINNLDLFDALWLFLGLTTAYRLGDDGLPG